MFPTSFFECPTKDLGHEVSDNDMGAAYGSGDLGEHSGSGYSSPTSAPTLPEAVRALTSSLYLSFVLHIYIRARKIGWMAVHHRPTKYFSRKFGGTPI